MIKTVAISACLLASLSGIGKAQEPIGAARGPEVSLRGCIAFQHRDFKGRKFTFRGDVNIGSVVDGGNANISSLACSYGCEMTSFEHRNFNGRSKTWGGAISDLGGFWNDRISSLYVRC